MVGHVLRVEISLFDGGDLPILYSDGFPAVLVWRSTAPICQKRYVNIFIFDTEPGDVVEFRIFSSWARRLFVKIFSIHVLQAHQQRPMFGEQDDVGS